MEADDRQVTTVFTVQPSFHHHHSTNSDYCCAHIVKICGFAHEHAENMYHQTIAVHKSVALQINVLKTCITAWGRYHGCRRPSSDDSFHSPAVIPPSSLDKLSIMKRYHRRRTCSCTSPRRSPTMVTVHDARLVPMVK